MKRLICLILTGILVLSLCACQKQEEYQSPVQFYYLRVQDPENLHHGSADSVIAPETREGAGHLNDVNYLLSQYLRGPMEETLFSPFPDGTTLVEVRVENGAVLLTLSDELSQKTGIDLTLACACLTLTALDLTGAETAEIRAETALLDGKETITMDRSTIILLDSAAGSTEATEN